MFILISTRLTLNQGLLYCALQEIEEIFTHSDCPSFLSVEYASGDCWYVDFETEEHAQDAFRYIRETLQTFKGKRIMVGQ